MQSTIYRRPKMRLWSLHPSLLDRMGLVALWREGLLAQKVLLGQTRGYRHHPQLERFRSCENPVDAISTYLWAVVDEAEARGYRFDSSKIVGRRTPISVCVTRGQMEFERAHLRRKLRQRDRLSLKRLAPANLKAHPMLRIVRGDVEYWEAVSPRGRRSISLKSGIPQRAETAKLKLR